MSDASHKSVPENPRAFAHGNPEQGGDPGMTLRDWFAGQALAGISSQLTDFLPNADEVNQAAANAYAFADAMLAQREASK